MHANVHNDFQDNKQEKIDGDDAVLDNGMLHADAEDDLRLIQEQLCQFSQQEMPLPQQRESIIKDHLVENVLDRPASILEQSCPNIEGELSQPQ